MYIKLQQNDMIVLILCKTAIHKGLGTHLSS